MGLFKILNNNRMESVEIFKKMIPALETSGAEIVKKVGCVYHFELRKVKGDKATVISIDLKNGNGKVSFEKEGKPDATFIMLDADFVKLASGKLKPQQAFMTGKMKIKGNMAKAMKFNPSVLPKGAKL